ncbi:hypothetical protein Ciccas_012706, partial [Cichlidogyrus casuarinus]
KLLTVLFVCLLQKKNFFTKFSINPGTLMGCMQKVETMYRKSVPYHNSTHGADVLQSAHVLVSSKSLKGIYSDLELFAMYFACAVHDVDHPGLTNQYLINTKIITFLSNSANQLALLYNDASVLENHHLYVAFSILSNHPDCDITSNLSKKQRQAFRKIVIDIVSRASLPSHE